MKSSAKQIPIKSGIPFTPIDFILQYVLDMTVVMAFHSHFKFSATCVTLNKDEKQLLLGILPDSMKPMMSKLGLKWQQCLQCLLWLSFMFEENCLFNFIWKDSFVTETISMTIFQSKNVFRNSAEQCSELYGAFQARNNDVRYPFYFNKDNFKKNQWKCWNEWSYTQWDKLSENYETQFNTDEKEVDFSWLFKMSTH